MMLPARPDHKNPGAELKCAGSLADNSLWPHADRFR